MTGDPCWLNEDCVLGDGHEGACKFPSWFLNEDVNAMHYMGGPVDVTVGDVVQQIGRWKARRREPLHDPDKEYQYECVVRFNDEQWNTEFLIKHTYSDGAGVLIGKVFARYVEIKARAVKRSRDMLAVEKKKALPKPDTMPKKISERLMDLELEKDLREIKHRDPSE